MSVYRTSWNLGAPRGCELRCDPLRSTSSVGFITGVLGDRLAESSVARSASAWAVGWCTCCPLRAPLTFPSRFVAGMLPDSLHPSVSSPTRPGAPDPDTPGSGLGRFNPGMTPGSGMGRADGHSLRAEVVRLKSQLRMVEGGGCSSIACAAMVSRRVMVLLWLLLLQRAAGSSALG